jgi:hypothetical protein
MKKDKRLISQSAKVKGIKKMVLLLLTLSLTGTTRPTPDGVYGNEKSTYIDLFDDIVVSATTASYFCSKH